ncbi:Extended synaptotagminlike protein 2a, partial [Caligus rogercresseyi]
MKYRAFAPTGMLAVKVLFAKGLPSKGGLRYIVGKGDPDPYAKIILGATEFKNGGCQELPKSELGEIWLLGHRLNIQLFDKDTFSSDEFMGEIFIDLQNEF